MFFCIVELIVFVSDSIRVYEWSSKGGEKRR